jgi:hypothetical protein
MPNIMSNIMSNKSNAIHPTNERGYNTQAGFQALRGAPRGARGVTSSLRRARSISGARCSTIGKFLQQSAVSWSSRHRTLLPSASQGIEVTHKLRGSSHTTLTEIKPNVLYSSAATQLMAPSRSGCSRSAPTLAASNATR